MIIYNLYENMRQSHKHQVAASDSAPLTLELSAVEGRNVVLDAPPAGECLERWGS
jgi:hypothetical protein